MKVLYDATPDENGEHWIYHIVKDADWFWFTHTTNKELIELDIPETPPNQALCQDMMKEHSFSDESGRGKHVVKGGQVRGRDGWKRREMPMPVPESVRG